MFLSLAAHSEFNVLLGFQEANQLKAWGQCFRHAAWIEVALYVRFLWYLVFVMWGVHLDLTRKSEKKYISLVFHYLKMQCF